MAPNQSLRITPSDYPKGALRRAEQGNAWFFKGLRVQWWPTQNLKIEPWLINGWQSYAKFNSKPGVGGQILWIPNDSLKLVFNSYGVGQDNLSCQTNNTGTNAGTVDSLCQPQNGGNPRSAVGSCGRRWAGGLVEGEANSRRR
jgi:hypothetical protein